MKPRNPQRPAIGAAVLTVTVSTVIFFLSAKDAAATPPTMGGANVATIPGEMDQGGRGSGGGGNFDWGGLIGMWNDAVGQAQEHYPSQRPSHYPSQRPSQYPSEYPHGSAPSQGNWQQPNYGYRPQRFPRNPSYRRPSPPRNTVPQNALPTVSQSPAVPSNQLPPLGKIPVGPAIQPPPNVLAQTYPGPDDQPEPDVQNTDYDGGYDYDDENTRQAYASKETDKAKKDLNESNKKFSDAVKKEILKSIANNPLLTPQDKAELEAALKSGDANAIGSWFNKNAAKLSQEQGALIRAAMGSAILAKAIANPKASAKEIKKIIADIRNEVDNLPNNSKNALQPATKDIATKNKDFEKAKDKEAKPGGNHPGGNHPGGNHPGGNHPGGNHPGGYYPGGYYPSGYFPNGSYPNPVGRYPVGPAARPSRASVQGRPVAEAAGSATTSGILIINPPETNSGVAFLLGNRTYKIDSDSRQAFSLTARDRAVVAFDRGRDFGRARYTLRAGTYKFKVTEKGWELVRVTVQVTIDNNQLPIAFQYLVDGTRSEVGVGTSRKHVSPYPVEIAFDRGDGTTSRKRLDGGTYRVSFDPADNHIELFPVAAMTVAQR